MVPFPLFLQEEQQVFQAGQMPCVCSSYRVCACVPGHKGINRCTQWLHRDSAAERLLHFHLTNKTVRSIHGAPGVFPAREACHLLTDTGDMWLLMSLFRTVLKVHETPMLLQLQQSFGSSCSSIFQLLTPGRKAGLCREAGNQSQLYR